MTNERLQYAACWGEYMALGATPNKAIARLIEVELEPWVDNRADEERSTQLYQVTIHRAVFHRWGDVRDDMRWQDMEDGPDYDDEDATVYEPGEQVDRVEVELVYNATTDEWGTEIIYGGTPARWEAAR